MIRTAGAAAVAPTLLRAARKPWPILEGPDTPKLCLGTWDGGDPNRPEIGMRRIKQLGVNYVLGGGPKVPWQEDELRALIGRYKANGLTLYNLMISGFPNTIYGRPGRDEEIEKLIQSIRAAGRAGLPVIEYNFYAHRAMEGYYEETGRAGAGYTAFDYDRMRDLPPPQVGAYSAEQLWKNLTYFLKAVIPEAEEAGVRLALHPNDPPVPVSRG
ncbi:MAG: mannonate dehydratase, partial [Bryobacteraceae bacterium]